MEKLIACDPIMGLPRGPMENCEPDRDDLLSEMARLGITTAIVRHQSTFDTGPIIGNQAVLDATSDSDALVPACFVTPDGFEPDFDPAETVDAMLQKGVQVCWTDPQAEHFSPRPWCSGPLYEVIESRRVPLLMDYQAVNADDLDSILNNFPDLRLILVGVPRLGRNRLVYPLLRRHSNLYMCLSHTYSVHCGVEDLCTTFGHGRWVFGMGYPQAEGGAAITGLSYASICAEAKQAIAYQTIERLLKDVR